jgi:hypothetical protein
MMRVEATMGGAGKLRAWLEALDTRSYRVASDSLRSGGEDERLKHNAVEQHAYA